MVTTAKICSCLLSDHPLPGNLRAGSADNTTKQQQAHQSLRQLGQHVSHTKTAVAALEVRAQQITADTAQSAEVAAALDDTAGVIHQLISSQTNLLALNAV